MKRKGWVLSALLLVGALTFTMMVFAKPDTAEHNKSRDHRHRTSARSTAPYKDWVQ